MRVYTRDDRKRVCADLEIGINDRGRNETRKNLTRPVWFVGIQREGGLMDSEMAIRSPPPKKEGGRHTSCKPDRRKHTWNFFVGLLDFGVLSLSPVGMFFYPQKSPRCGHIQRCQEFFLPQGPSHDAIHYRQIRAKAASRFHGKWRRHLYIYNSRDAYGKQSERKPRLGRGKIIHRLTPLSVAIPQGTRLIR